MPYSQVGNSAANCLTKHVPPILKRCMKRDWRTLDHGSLEAIRVMAIERVREGEAPSSEIASSGFSRTTIYKWIAMASLPGPGLRALQARTAPGRSRSLTPG